MTWNHRLIAHKDGDDFTLQIHEVYYNESGDPISYTADSVGVSAEDIDGIYWVLDMMQKCTNKPILSAENFPKVWVEK